MAFEKNKIRYGLRNVHYALLTEGEEADTYGTVKKIPGVVKTSLTRVGTYEEFFADDVEYYRFGKNNGYDGTIEFAELPEELDTAIFGEVLDADGVSFEKVEAPPVAIALFFEFQGDKFAIRRCLYKVYLSKPSVEGESTEKPTVKTNTLNVQARPNRAGYVQAKTTSQTADEKYAAWYNAVPTFVAPVGG